MLCDATMTAPGAVGTLWTTAFITPPCSAHRLPRRVGAPGSPFAAGPSFVHAQEAAIPSRWRPHLCGGPGPIGGRPSEARPQLVREYNLSHYPVGHGLPSLPPDRTLFTGVRGIGFLGSSGLRLYPGMLCAMAHIHPPQSRVCCLRYVTGRGVFSTFLPSPLYREAVSL
jgi:hypothetical protein